MQKTLIALIALTAISAWIIIEKAPNPQITFEQYKLDYGKTYSQYGEEQYRKAIFTKNYANILKHNSNPLNTYTKGINQFTDWSQTEFQSIYLNDFIPKTGDKPQSEKLYQVGVNIDWQAAGKVSPVKDQGRQCGSSWAFSATGAIESAYLIKGKSVLISEQELLDCSGDYGNLGCNGGYMTASFKYVIDKKIHQSQDYPYTGQYQKCQKPTGQKWKLSNFVENKGCDFLTNALFNGPVSTAVDASGFSSYKSGILNQCISSANHGTLVVGATDTYWKLKQTFGANWGEKGFIRIVSGNKCGVCDYPTYPII